MIRVSNLSAYYDTANGRSMALEDMNLHVPKGGTCAIIGPSGCGKSTLLRILAGIAFNYEGEVLVADAPVNPKALSVGFIPQNYGLLPWRTVRDNIRLSWKVKHPESPVPEGEESMLVRLGIGEELLDRFPRELSGGQQQRASLARAFLLQPDVLLIDLNMPGLSGIEVTKQLVAARVKTRIIALTVHDSDRYVLEMLRNGALGYILKDVEPTMLIKAIHVVANGGTFVYPKLAERIFGGLSDGADVKAKAKEMWRDGRGDRLTAREMDVLACIAKGFSNQDIAKALFVSEKTVKNHLTNIFRKLNVNDRTQALIYVLKHKIVSLE